MEKKSNNKVLFATFVVVLCVLVVTVMPRIVGSSNYYATSSVVIALALLPFIFSFGGRKPKAMELIVLAVLCVIGIAARAAFVAFPAFKPMTGIIIITGMAFGPQAGFLTGIMTLFLSNFIFGHGPWTPWQMFAFGFAGFISGLLADRGILPKTNRNIVAIYGYLLIQLVVGPFLDLSSFVMTIGLPTNTSIWDMLKSGFSYNMVHGVAVALLILLLYDPIMEKLERIKVKYGMLEDEPESFEDIFGEEETKEGEEQ